MPDPNLGYDKTSTTDLDTFNQWFRARPEYAAKLQEFGQTPDNVHLNDDQKQQMVRLAQSLGAVINEGRDGQEVDDSGNFRNQSHKLKTGLIIAGIAGAALATAGVAGVFSGAAAPAAAGGLSGVEAGATAGLGAAALPGAGTALIAPGLEASLLGAGGSAAGLSGVEAGAAAGLGDAALPGAMATLPGAAGEAAAAGGAFDAAGNFIGDSSIPGATGSFDAAASTGLGSTLGKLGSTLGKIGPIAGAIGKGIGAVDAANGQNRLDQEHAGLTANAQNITGQSAFEQELMARAKEDDSQRSQARKDAYRDSYAKNPRVSPFDPVGAPKFSSGYTGSLAALADQANKKLSTASPYDTNGMAPLAPYKPIDPADVQGATNTKPSTLSQVGQWVGPGLSAAQLIAQMWK